MTNTKRIFVEQNSRTALTAYAAEAAATSTWPQYLAAILATLGAFSAGTCLSWTSPALPVLAAGGDGLPQLTPEEGSWVGSLITLGAFMGALPAGALANFTGRKTLIQLLSLPILASWLLIAYSVDVWGLYGARLMAGMSVGALSVAIPMYVAELAESRVRGSLGTLFQLQITAGILFEYLIGMADDYKLFALIPAAVPVIFLVSFSWMPESPQWLVGHGKPEKARSALQFFRGKQADVEDELTKITDHLIEDRKETAHFTDLLNSKAAKKGLVISLGLMVFQQLCGINAVIFYAEKIFDNTNSGLPTFVTPIIIGSVMVVATYLSTILIDRAGRRVLLLVSSIMMSLCLGLLAVYFYLLESDSGITVHFTVPILCVAVYITVFSLGFGPIPWMMLGEIFPAKFKGMASSIAASLNWVLAFTVTKLFQTMLDCLGSGLTFGIFTLSTVLAAIFVLCIVPETKGKDIREIQEMLSGDKRIEEPMNDVIVIEIKK